MDLEQDYIEYVAEFSFALLAISAAYFFDPYRPITFLTLALIPVLFGYTAYISRESFSHSSFLAMIALIFAVINYKLAFIALIISVGNVLVSVFAGGERFRDFYRTTALPMLIVGILAGAGAFYGATSNPAIADNIRNTSATFLGNTAESAVENAGLVEDQKEVQKMIVEETSSQAVTATKYYLINETRQISGPERQELINTMEEAEEEIPQKMTEEAEERIEAESIDISTTVSDLVESNLQGSTMMILVPITALFLYSLQPVVGLLTAVFASLFAFAARRGSEE